MAVRAVQLRPGVACLIALLKVEMVTLSHKRGSNGAAVTLEAILHVGDVKPLPVKHVDSKQKRDVQVHNIKA